MVLREADVGSRSGTGTSSLREVHIQRHGGPALKQPSFYCNTVDKHVELLNFEIEITTYKAKNL